MDTAASGEQSRTDGSPQQPDSNESGGDMLDLTTADVDIEQPQIFYRLLGALVKNLAGTWRGSQRSPGDTCLGLVCAIGPHPNPEPNAPSVRIRLISLISVYIGLAYQPDIETSRYQSNPGTYHGPTTVSDVLKMGLQV